MRRHAEWYLELARESWRSDRGENVEWLDRLDRERANLRAALEFWRSADVDSLLELAGLLSKLWRSRGGMREGRAWLEEALASSRPDPTAARERVLSGAFVLAHRLGDLDRARRAAEERLEVARALGLPSRIAAALSMLSGLAADAGDFGQAIQLQEEALAVCRSEPEAADLLRVMLHNLGYAYERAGDYERARAAFENALDLEPDGSIGRVITLNALGAIRICDGRPEEARPLLTEAMRTAADAGVLRTFPDAIGLFAAVEADTRRAERAAPLLAWWRARVRRVRRRLTRPSGLEREAQNGEEHRGGARFARGDGADESTNESARSAYCSMTSDACASTSGSDQYVSVDGLLDERCR